MISGQNYIGNKLSAEGSQTFQAVNANDGTLLEEKFYSAMIDEVEAAVNLADDAFENYSNLDGKKRAEFLRAIAEEIENLGDELIKRASLETALPEARFIGERGRTVGQLKQFADLLEKGDWVEARIDTAQPERQPLPKPDLRKLNKAIGPVVVFGASNFPLAFSTAGGDTASALAAGCPVIVKAHPAHPGTGELVASAIIKAAEKTGMPNGVFSNLNDSGFNVGEALVKHPKIKAVGFTGSLRGGRALYDLAQKREEPIPVFAEMGSVNPVVIFEEALNTKSEKIAEMYAGSITLGVGQFCTNPGLILAVDTPALNSFISNLSKAIKNITPAAMLTGNIADNYRDGLKKSLQQKGVKLEGSSDLEVEKYQARAAVASVSGSEFLDNPKLHNEVFGPYSLIVKCKDENELNNVINSLEGQLTVTVMADNKEIEEKSNLIKGLERKVGRLIYNGVPTGVEVCSSMHHGGPYPASTDSRFTSVGTDAIKRFIRPVSYQDWPAALLPDELKDSNPLGIWRIVNGEYSNQKIK